MNVSTESITGEGDSNLLGVGVDKDKDELTTGEVCLIPCKNICFNIMGFFGILISVGYFIVNRWHRK